MRISEGMKEAAHVMRHRETVNVDNLAVFNLPLLSLVVTHRAAAFSEETESEI